VDEVLKASDRVEKVAGEAVEALADAEALDGREAVRSASFAAKSEVPVEVSTESVMGVRVPRVAGEAHSRSLLERGYGLVGTSSRIDLAAGLFEEEVSLILELASTEMRLRKLAEEIQKTTRRVNALDNILIPRLLAQRRYIEMVLEEREREDLFRLKRVKQALTKKAAARAQGDQG
jgi:V/A-type H+-transporting ATPase subunit D